MSRLDLRWIYPTLGILCIEYLAAYAIGTNVGFAYEIPFKAFAVTGATIAAAGLCLAVVWHLFRLWREGESHPSRYILGRLPWAFGVGVMFVALQSAVLNWSKVMMPLVAGFWADPTFAALDRMLFGQDPWKISHELFGQFTPEIDAIYALWSPIMIGSLYLLLCLPASTRKARALTAFFLLAACGSLGQYLGASAGPIFYERLDLGDQFKDIPISTWVGVTRDYLWNDHLRGGGRVGGGISAMPSVHVAVALWIALVLRSYLPRLQVIGWLYFAVILVGSVHLGWHYAVDGLASCAFVPIVWKLAKVMATVPLERARQPAPSGET